MCIRLFRILIVLLLLFFQVSCKKPTTESAGTEEHSEGKHSEEQHEKHSKGDHAEEHHEEHGKGEHSEEQHEEHSEGEHAEEQKVQISSQEMEEFDIEVAEALPGRLHIYLTLPGEVVYDPDRLVHIVPRVSGIVCEVRKKMGDTVLKDEVMSVIDSRELASAKAKYFAANEKVSLAEATYNREKKLRDKNISSEREYLNARTNLAEARIQLRIVKYQLVALGFSKKYVQGLKHDSADQGHLEITTPLSDTIVSKHILRDEHVKDPKHDLSNLGHFEIMAPFSGTIVEKHITLGEKVGDNNAVFTVADLCSVWVYLTVYQKDMDTVKVGQPVTIRTERNQDGAKSKIDFVSPVVEENTRTATARVVLDNSKGTWRPGSFVTGEIMISEFEVEIVVPRTALQVVEDKNVIFVETDGGFEPRPVTVGRKDEANIEILSGLNNGERYISKGGFTLKSELSRSGLEHAGHAH
jgi:cobalt-zinc-cadmium efflux system membrane fusion protein